MSDSMLPILRQLLDADGDAVRAGVLLRLPDTILLKYRPAIEKACQRARFDAGLAFLDVRLAALRAVRGADGRLPPDYAADLERMLDAFAAAGQSAVGSRQSGERAAAGPTPPGPAGHPPLKGEGGRLAGDRLPTADCPLPGSAEGGAR